MSDILAITRRVNEGTDVNANQDLTRSTSRLNKNLTCWD